MIWIDVDPSVQIAWSIANLEACRSGNSRIEPVHFLLGLLKVVDVNFVEDVMKNDVAPEVAESVIAVAEECRRRLGLSGGEIKRVRRTLRKALGGHVTSTQVITLHRSDASRSLFKRAGKRAVAIGADEISLPHLLDELAADWPPEASTILPPPQLTSQPEREEEWPTYLPNPFGK